MTFILDTSRGKNIGIAEITGRLDASNSNDLQKAFLAWQQQTPMIVFDCSALDFLDSSGLGAIVGCLRKALELNGDLRLASLNATVAMVFELTKAKKLFSIFPDTQQAIASFRKADKT